MPDTVGEDTAAIQVGLVGYGFAGRVFHAPLIRAVPGLHLHSVVSRDAERVLADCTDVQTAGDAQTVIDDPTVGMIVIATPNLTHYSLARAALEAGKHVVVDKPFVIKHAEGVELQSIAAEKDLILSVFHNRRWDGDFLTVKHCIDSGELGEINTYKAHFDRFAPHVNAGWRESPEPGAGVLNDLGAHLIDQALQLFGEPQSLTANLGVQRPGAVVDDYFHLQLDYGPKRVILHAGMLVPSPGPRYEIHGSLGSFHKGGIDAQEAALIAGRGPLSKGWGQESTEFHGVLTCRDGDEVIRRVVETRVGAYESFYVGMREAILRGAPNPVTTQQALAVVRVIERAQRSHRLRCTVNF